MANWSDTTYISLTTGTSTTSGGYITTTPYTTYPAGQVTWTSGGGMPARYEEHECGIHDLKYKATRPGCPVCEQEREIKALTDLNKRMSNELIMKDQELQKLQVNWDLLIAMKAAVDLVGSDDLAFFKTVLYQWRDEKSVGLKFTYGYDDNKKKKSVNGFIVLPRKGDPWGYACTSIGGLAIASYFEEACAARGSMEAMAILTRALSDHLPGSLDEPGHTPS